MKKTFIITLVFVLCDLALYAQISFDPFYFDNPGFSISSFIMKKGTLEEYMRNDSAYLKPLHSFGFKISYVKLLNFSDRFALSTGFTFGKFFHSFEKNHLTLLESSKDRLSYFITEFPLSFNRRFIVNDKISISADLGIKLIFIEENSYITRYWTLITKDSARLNYLIYMDIAEDLGLFVGLNGGFGLNYLLPNRNFINFRLGITMQFPQIDQIVEGDYEFYQNGNTISAGEYELYLSYLEFQVSYFFCRNKKWAKLGMPKPVRKKS